MIFGPGSCQSDRPTWGHEPARSPPRTLRSFPGERKWKFWQVVQGAPRHSPDQICRLSAVPRRHFPGQTVSASKLRLPVTIALTGRRVRGTQYPGKTASTRRESAATLTPPPDFVSRRQRMGSRLVGYGVLAGCLRAQTCHSPQSGLPITQQHTQVAATVWPTYQRRPQPVREVFPTAFWIEKVPCLFLSAVRIAGRKPWSTTTTPIKPVTVPSVVEKLPSPHCRRLAPRPLAGPIQHTSHPAAL